MNQETNPRPAGSRRRVAVSRERTISPITLLAMLIPLLTVGALATVDPAPTEDSARPPHSAPLTRSLAVCPPALPGTERVSMLVAGEQAGQPGGAGGLGLRGSEEGVAVRPDQVATFDEQDKLVIQGEGKTAPGLVAVRSAAGASLECASPAADLWFTGVGAGAEHRSVLQLVNPDGGPAVAEVTVLGEDGPVDVPGLRGLTVRGNRMVRIDLADVVPRRDELALHVVVTRGRLASSVVDRFDELGTEVGSADWLADQPVAATTSYLLGLGGGTGSRTLVLANGGTDQARVAIKLVTARSEFSPAGLDELVVPPGSTVVADLGPALGGKSGRGAVGIRLDSDHPVTATLRSVTGEDLSHAVAGPQVTSRAATPLGAGPKRLVLAGASEVSKIDVVLRDEAGEQIGHEQITLQPGLGVRTALASDARSMELEVSGGSVHATLESGPPGLAVRGLRELVVDRKVPQVRPALY